MNAHSQSHQSRTFAQTPHNQFPQPNSSAANGLSKQAHPQQQQQQHQRHHQRHQQQQKTLQEQMNDSLHLQGNSNGVPQSRQPFMRQANGNPTLPSGNDNVQDTQRPGLHRNSNFNGSTASSQTIPAQSSQPNGNAVKGRPGPPSRTMSHQASAQTSSGHNSQGQTPAMGSTSSPVIGVNNGQEPLTRVPQGGPSRQGIQVEGAKQPSGGIPYRQAGPQNSMQPQFNMPNESSAFVPRRPVPLGQSQQHQHQHQQMMTPADQMQQEFNTRIIKRNLGNAATMRVLDLIDFLSNEAHDNLRSVEFWQRITPVYFLPNSTIRLSFAKFITSQSDKSLSEVTGLNFNFLKSVNKGINDTNAANHFELNTTTAPRFFANCAAHSEFTRFSVFLPGMKFQVLNNGSIIIVSKLEINLTYDDDSTTKLNGNVKILMSRDLRIEWIDVNCLGYESLINLNILTKSPQRSKPANDIYNNLKTVQNMSTFGLGKTNTRNLQLIDVLTHMKQLIDFSQLNNIKAPQRALELLLSTPQAAVPTNFRLARGPFPNGFGVPPQRQPMQFQNPMREAAAAPRTTQQESMHLQQPPKSVKQEGQQSKMTDSYMPQSETPSPKTITEDPKKKRKSSAGGGGLQAGNNKKRK
ncbi:hypothetical protein KGF57_000240 [Candida theae]|uniref:Morphogenetic regulator of filamentous growth protein 1 n=1 Tax=Candida theae TaxID=1198502 RepID=A0AAD5G121_9ASCO|nr:uncharacterized protein KGF57_000240 [Candida theae]KAI5968157.1 hypothetical protein KGF57_000240 [Candida theae]